MIANIISFAIAIALATVVHKGARNFVRNRLRYVDAVQKGFVPFLAGGAAMLVFMPLAAIFPFGILGVGTALTVGFATGSGVAAGVRDIRSGVSPLISDRF
jgi:hypothetical protein